MNIHQNFQRYYKKLKFFRQKKMRKINPYYTKVSEYDIENATEEDWMRFAKLLDKVDVEKEFGGSENTYSKTTKFYKLLVATTDLLFKKKKAFEDETDTVNKEEGNGSNNKIPKKVRKLMKRKAKLSSKAMSISWSKNHEVLREIEDIEAKLVENYKSNRIKQENIAIKN